MKILYKDIRNKKTFKEDELSLIIGKSAYIKYYYTDDEKLVKQENFNCQGILTSTYFYLQLFETKEEILYKNPHAIIYTILKEINGYIVYEKESYQGFELSEKIIEVRDEKGRMITEMNLKYEEYHKYLHVDDEIKRISYFEWGEMKDRFSSYFEKKHEVNNEFYTQLYPIIPDCEFLIPETKVEYRNLYDIKLKLDEAFKEDDFTKYIYEQDRKIIEEEFCDGILESRTYYLKPEQTIQDILKECNYNIDNIIYYNQHIVNNYVVWDINYYGKQLRLGSKDKKVFNLNDEEIASQSIDATNNKVIKTQKYSNLMYHEDPFDFLPFTYDENGKIEEKIKINYDKYCINDFKEKGFFNTEYGRYFLTDEPLVPYVKGPEKIECIYKNHLEQIIDEVEIKYLYEYKKEIYVNGFLKEVYSYIHKHIPGVEDLDCIGLELYSDQQRLEDIIYDSIIKNFDFVFYNKRINNNYIVYDVEKYDYTSDLKYNGILVQDSQGREIVRVIYQNDKTHIQYAHKIFYDNPVKGDSAENYHLVEFDKYGNPYRYKRFHWENCEIFSKEKYEKYEPSSKVLQNPFYKNLRFLIPPFPCLKYEELVQKPQYIKIKNDYIYRKECYYNENHQLRIYHNSIFLYTYEDLTPIKQALTIYEFKYYYNIKRNTDFLTFRCLYKEGLEIDFSINLETLQMQYEVTKCKEISNLNSEINKVLENSNKSMKINIRMENEREGVYHFLYNDQIVENSYFNLEELIYCLLEAIRQKK